ncbi:MAG: hypothetical protein ACOX9R_14800 [Armatimonadota bacterium]|jgi:hypothetical protein
MKPEPGTLILAAAIIAAWLVGQAVAWKRVERDERDELGRFIGGRLSRHWPLLAALLAPLAAVSLAPQREAWLLAAVVAVIAWWGAESLGALKQSPGLVRDPLRYGAAAARGLWRSRWLLAIFLAMWLLSTVVASLTWAAHFRRDPDMGAHIRQRLAESPFDGFRERLSVEAAGEALVGTIGVSFPSASGELGGGWEFAVLAMAVGFGCLRFGSWLPPARRARMAWPFRLTVLMALVAMQQHLFWFRPTGEWPGEPAIAAWLVWGISELSFIWGAPATAASFCILLQVARAEHWNPRRALVAASDSWPLFVPMLLVVYLPSLLFIPIDAHAVLPAGFFVLMNNAWPVLHLGLVLVPWIMIDRRVGLRAALAWEWTAATEHASDLMAFVLRYAAAMSALAVVVEIVAPSHLVGLSHPVAIARAALHAPPKLLGTLAVGVLYFHLREGICPPIAKGPSDDPDAGVK